MTNIVSNDNFNNSFLPFTSVDKRRNSSYSSQDFNSTTLHKDSYETEKPKKRRSKGVWALATSGVALGVLGFLVIVGAGPKGLYKKAQETFLKLRSSADNVKNTYLHKFLTQVSSTLDRTSRIITNSSPIKDYALLMAMEQTAPTRKLLDKINNLFTRENKSSVQKSIKKTKGSYHELIDLVDSAVRKSSQEGSLVKDGEKLRELKELLATSRELPEFLSEQGFEKAFGSMQDDMKFLRQEMSIKRLLSKEALHGFVPEDILMQRRARYAKRLFEEKNKISFEFRDISQSAREEALNTNILIYSVKDPQAQKQVKDAFLRFGSLLKTYDVDCVQKGKGAALEAVRGAITDFRQSVAVLPSGEVREKLMLKVEECSALFEDRPKGTVQKITDLAEEIWGKDSKFALDIKKAADKHSGDLNLTLTRLTNMFDKQRDIVLGSGPGDLLGLAVPAIVFGVELKKDKNNDERIGTSLELGIPLFAGSLVYLKTLALQFNGFKALGTSFASGLVLNFIGSAVYKKYLKYVESKNKAKASATATNS